MSKTIRRTALPLFLAVLIIFSIFPLTAFAESPDISIEPISGVESEAVSSAPNSEVDISTTPNKGGVSSAPEGETPSSQPSDPDGEPAPDDGDASEPESAPESSPEAEPQGDDSISVSIVGGNGLSRGIGVLAAGNLTIHKFDAYQWNFGFSHGGSVDVRPWYIMDIGGQLAYCVEPQNPDTTSGGYGTIDYNALNVTQHYSIGYAMLYGAQDMSNPLFHMATQTIIWEIALGYMDLSTFTCINKSACHVL